MPTSLTIPKNPVYPPSMDFRLLRREGIKHLERLGSAIWTDYNEHDPGITMLEVLDYAITDLGYRTNLPATDLFALPTDRKPFFTAADILTNGPVTALDLRKIIIDIPGVRNAWVQCGGAPEVLMVVSSDARQLEEVLQAHLLQAYRAVIGDGPSASLWNAATISSLQSALVSYHQATDLNAKQAALKQLTSILFTATTPDTTQTFTSALLLYTVDHRLASVSAFLEDEIKQAPTPGKEALPQKLLALSRLLNELSISLNDYRQQKSDADNARLNDVRNKLADIQNLLKDVATSAIIPPDIKAHLIGGSLLVLLLDFLRNR